jgi:hypothetical protein
MASTDSIQPVLWLKNKLAFEWFTSLIMTIVLLLALELLYVAQTAHSTFEITLLYIIAFATLINTKSIYRILKSES